MQKLFVVLLIAAIATAQIDDWHTCAESIIKLETDLVDFGFWVEVQVKDVFIKDVEKIIVECKAKSLNPNDWASCASLIFEMGEHVMQFGDRTVETVKNVFIPDVVKIEGSCKKEQIDEQINDWPTCLEDISKIVELASKITDDIKKFNFVNLVKDIQELYNVVQKAIKDCTKTSLELSQDSDWPTCLEDVSKIVELASKITDDIKKFNFVNLVKDIQELYNVVQKAIKDCTKTKLELSQDQDWPTCLQDIAKIAELAAKITGDIKKFNFVQLVKDINELYSTVQKALKDCVKSEYILPELNDQDWPTCLEDVSKIVELASRITSDIKKFDFVALVKDVQELYNVVQKAIKDCTK